MSGVIKVIASAQMFLTTHLYVLLLIPLIVIIIPLAKPGISITGDFPYLDTPDYAIKRLSMWIENGSIDGFEFLPRFPMLGLWYVLGFVGFTSALATKIMIVLGFFLSSILVTLKYMYEVSFKIDLRKMQKIVNSFFKIFYPIFQQFNA